MATIREYFDCDCPLLVHCADVGMQDSDGQIHGPVLGQIAHDFEANAKFLRFYIPGALDVNGCVKALLTSPDTTTCSLPSTKPVSVWSGFQDYSETASSETLVFTRRIH